MVVRRSSVSFWIVSSTIILVLLFKIRWSTNVLVMNRDRDDLVARQGPLLELVSKNGDDAAPGGAHRTGDDERASARSIEALGAERATVAGQREDGAEAKLRVAVPPEDARNHAPNRRSVRVAPRLHSGRRPFAVIAVGLGLVLFARDVRPLRSERARVRRDAFAAVKDLDGAARCADVHRGADELARRAVMSVVEGHVVVNVDLRFLPMAQLVAPCRKSLHGRAVDALEGRTTATVEFLEGARVQLFEKLGDRLVQRCKAEELAVAQSGEDPPLRDEHAGLDLRFVSRLGRARRDDRRLVMLAELEVRRIDLRVVAVGARDGAAELIGNQHLRNGAEVLEAADR